MSDPTLLPSKKVNEFPEPSRRPQFVSKPTYRGPKEGAVVTGREKYHSKAQAVIRAAEALPDPGERIHLLEIARCYLNAAKHVRDRRHEGTPHRVEARQIDA